MPWKWYSIYDIDHPHPLKNLSDAEIERSITLLKSTADVHDTHNFPSTTSISDHRDAVKAKADAGFLVIAYHPKVNANHSDDTLYFQYSKSLSGPHVIDETAGTWKTPPFTDVWVVSHGLDPDENNFPAAANAAFCKGYIVGRLNGPMRKFMTFMSLSALYSVDWGTPDADPTGRRIGKLQKHGDGDKWQSKPSVHYRGTKAYHYFWGEADGEFRLTEFVKKGP